MTGVTNGTSTITVTYQGKSVTVSVTISISTVSGNVLTATIDGVAFTGQAVTVAQSMVNGTTFLGIGGTNGFTGNYILLAIGVPAAPGTYGMALPSPANAGLQIPNATSLWHAGAGAGSGTITVTSVTANTAAGTFSLTLDPLTGTKATGQKSVTNGVFNVKF